MSSTAISYQACFRASLVHNRIDRNELQFQKFFNISNLIDAYLCIKYFTVPTISMFYGIIIRMYYAPKEHNPPHIHAYYQNSKATLKITDGEIIDGNLPVRQVRLIQAWIEIHNEELLADWALCQNGEKPFQIEPLK